MLKSVLLVIALVFNSFNANAQIQEETATVVTTEFSNTGMEEQMASADVAFLEKLKNEGFDFNQKDANGNPPLYYLLARNPDLDVAKKAIEFGADVNMPAKNGMIPLNIATSKANELQLQIMMMKTMGLNTDEPTIQEELKKNLFHEMTRAIEMTKLLIDNGADVNLVSSLGTPLMNAVTNVWNLDIVKMLIEAKADLNATDKNGRTALFYAYASNNDAVVELLIENGADTSLKDVDGKTYLEMQKVSVEPAI
ncbi:MAG: ankyrin repeat domain-containing protein [Alphaproteobacteria bacterium]|nr:ankyrin repeat domain-containing protein [Alphaproteobacteria bacterium]